MRFSSLSILSLALVAGVAAAQKVSKDEAVSDDLASALGIENVFARAELEPRSGSNAEGEVILSRTPYGIQVTVKVANVSPGIRGIHVHEKGDCSARDASSAGAHWNPGGRGHGFVGFADSHAGDFGNIVILENGIGAMTLPLKPEMARGAFDFADFIGKAVVLHSGPDDLVSQPSGNSGDRIACGVLQPVGS